MIIVLYMSGCRALPGGSATGHELLRVLRGCGVKFLPISCSPVIDPHPERKVSPGGSIYNSIGVEHPLLGRPFGHGHGIGSRDLGSADMSSMSYVDFSQSCHSDHESWQPLADALWRFGLHIRPALRPDYACLDQMGSQFWRPNDDLQLKYLMWRNLFGPPFIEKYGRDFFWVLRASA